jgi:CheY-like chemotaxis protein
MLAAAAAAAAGTARAPAETAGESPGGARGGRVSPSAFTSPFVATEPALRLRRESTRERLKLEARALEEARDRTSRRKLTLTSASRSGADAFIPSAHREGNFRWERYDDDRGARGTSDGNAATTTAAREDVHCAGAASGGGRPTALVVEDSAPTRLMLSKLLRRLDFETTEARNGAEAIRACELAALEEGVSANEPFAVVLMDKEMPVMDGHEATERLRKMGIVSPIVGVTANVLAADRDDFRAKGITEFLAKPVRKEALVETLRTLGLCGRNPFRADDRTEREDPPKRAKKDTERSSPEDGGGSRGGSRRGKRGVLGENDGALQSAVTNAYC